jgi:hypothetical protein
MKKTAVLILAMSGMLLGNQVAVTFVGPSAPDTFNNIYVGPYDLTVDGVPVVGTCISWDLEVGPPWSWEANKIIMDAIPTDQVATYLEAEWLNQQFDHSTDWVGIHKTIWALFGAPYSDPDTIGWEQAAEQNYPSVANSFYMLFPENIGEAQAFLVTVPEPTMLVLIGGGLLFIGLLSVRGAHKGKRSHGSDCGR